MRVSPRSGLSAALRLQFDEPPDDVAVALARLAHGPHANNDGRLDLDEALAPFTLHGPPGRALGRCASAASRWRSIGPTKSCTRRVRKPPRSIDQLVNGRPAIPLKQG